VKRKCSKCDRPWQVSIKSTAGKYVCPYCSKKRPLLCERGSSPKQNLSQQSYINY